MWQTRMFQALPSLENYRWLLLTLTVKNCDVSDLNKTVKAMQSAFVKMRKRKMFASKIVGYVKALEVTRSESGQAHPHFHLMLLVEPSYFNGRNYAKKDDWANEWQACLSVDYQPICDIRAIKDGKGKGIGGAVLEVLKYETKQADLVKYPDFLMQLALQMKGTRAIELGGLIKQKLKNADDDKETDEAMITESDDSEQVRELGELWYSWSRFNKYYKLADTYQNSENFNFI